MKTLFTLTTLSLVALASVQSFAQVRKPVTRRGKVRSSRPPMTKIVIGSDRDYINSPSLARKVRRLERVMNMMQDRIMDLEAELYYSDNSYGNNYNLPQYQCKMSYWVHGRNSRYVDNVKATGTDKYDAKHNVYTKCLKKTGHNYNKCDKDRITCKHVGL